MSGVTHLYGAAAFSPERKFQTLEAANDVLDVLEKAGVGRIDTAQIYGESERFLSELDAGSRFVIDSKAAGAAVPGALKRDELVRRARASLAKLKVKQFDIFYIHMPDPAIQLEETLAGIQDLYREGVFRRLGLSNYLAADVEKIHAHCASHDYILPTVYQGCYNPVARRVETELFPVLRKLDIAFYAYGPQAGGFLAKSKEAVLEGQGRFDPSNRGGQMLRRLYCRPALLDCLEQWADIASAAGCSAADLACRWVKYNSMLRPEYGDAIIFSSSTLAQTEQTLSGLEQGPLEDEIVRRIDKIWDLVKHEAPLDNVNG